MSDSTNITTDEMTDNDGPTRLRNAQRRIRDAYFDHDAGLFVLNCNPGAGKSVTVVDIAAEELLRRYVDGNPTPEQRVCVISFARDDAASFVPEIVARLRELVEHDLTPAATAVSEADLEYLVRRVRHAPFVGTIDSVFRSLLGEFVMDVGFDAMPAVGNDGQLDRLHADCYEAVASEPANTEAIDVVEAAYPPDEYDDGPAALLRQAHHECRARRLTTAEFRAELHDTVAAVYAEGETTSIRDIADALARCVDPDAASQACSELDESDSETLVSADQQLQAEWRDTIDAFCTLLETYRDEYATRIRERSIISHTDCAFLVAEFLNGRLGTTDVADAKRERVLARYRSRFESVIIDEAQDVAELQHAALTPLITAECRVLSAGDLRQSIYGFRDAHPSIFQRAAEDGRYFGIDWNPHVTETAATTYRCTPDVAAAINSIAEPALTDATRGNLGELDVTFPPLDAAREPTTEPNVHIAAFDTAASPGSPDYVAPDAGKGEAGILATYIANGLADGTLGDTDTGSDGNGDGDGDDGQPDVAVLFRWRTQMARYADAFESEGLSVANASDYLFECPVVTAVLDVAEWLVDPADSERVQTLVTDSSLGLDGLVDAFDDHGWCPDAVCEDATTTIDVTGEQRDVLDRLYQLREERSAFRAQSAAASIADIIECLVLRADPNECFPGVPPAQRVANLDALVHLVTEWERDSPTDLTDIVEMLAPVRADPHTGPTQPVTGADDHDVVFQTIHQAKGSEADVVALADLGWSLRKLGPTSQRLVAAGPMLGLAPPVNAAAPSIDALSVYTRGLYDPTEDDGRFGPTPFPGDVGLRWASERWTDDLTGDHSATGLAGHDRVQTATQRNRAEAFRLLYVALSRAKHHLVVPLPRTVPGPARPRDRWLETIRDGLQFDGSPPAGTYTLDVETPDGTTRSIDVAVNDVEPFATDNTRDQRAATNTPFAATTSPDRDNLPSLVPRILRPSTLYPLSDDPDQYLLDHLQGRALHTDTDTVDDDLPLTLDAFDTEAVGQFVHGVLTTAVQNGVSAIALRTVNEEIQQIIEDQLHEHGPPATDAERDGLLTFLTEDVLPTVVESDLWAQLERAEEVYVEKRLRGHVRRNGVEFELEGQADFVLRHPDGTYTVADTKIALTDPNTNTRHRYRVQVACYAWLLAREADVDDPTTITTAVETFGAVNDRTVEPLSPSMIRNRLDELLDGGW